MATKTSKSPSRIVASATAAATCLAGGLLLTAAPAAQADPRPERPQMPASVAADIREAPQINGVVWTQAIAAGKVWVGGKFTKARPYGAKPGTSEVNRLNLLAYDVETGRLVKNFAPRVNGEVKVIEASEDGKTVYVGGLFTSIDNNKIYRIAAFNAVTGKLIRGFNPKPDYRVNAIAVKGNTVYFGGKFNVVAGQKRRNVAAVDARTGQIRPWAPQADRHVLALEVSPDGKKVAIGGGFDRLNGQNRPGIGLVDATRGNVIRFKGHPHVDNSTRNAAINSITADKKGFYISGYSYDPNHGFEGTAGFSWNDGTPLWVNGSKGDTYGVHAMNGLAYVVGHQHDGGPIGGMPQEKRWTYQYAYAHTLSASPFGRRGKAPTSGSERQAFVGFPAPELSHWWPELKAGKYTGLNQAAWSVSGNGKYLVLGGEFVKVNGVWQQGLTRFAIKEHSPRREGPRKTYQINPAVRGEGGGKVRVDFRSVYDRDSRDLTYQLYRGNKLVSSTKVSGGTRWYRPNVTLRDNAPRGTHDYRIMVRDNSGNVTKSRKKTFRV